MTNSNFTLQRSKLSKMDFIENEKPRLSTDDDYNTKALCSEMKKDVWVLENLNIPCNNCEIYSLKKLNFRNISQKIFKEEVKLVFQMWIKIYAVSTLKGRITAINKFSEFLYHQYPLVDSAEKITREIMEDYLSYNALCTKGKSSVKLNIVALKSLLEDMGRIKENTCLQQLIINDDIPRIPKCKFKTYTEEEQKTWIDAIKYMDEQKGRAYMLHILLGTRISEILMLQQDCLVWREDHWWIKIESIKTKGYYKPITDEMKILIDKSITYTKEKYQNDHYVFVNDYNSKEAMKYSSIRNHLKRIIKKYDLRDRNGELFAPKTHIFRHCYATTLTQLHIDDITIARLLGHANTDSVGYYRRMGNKVLAEETRNVRQKMDEILMSVISTWDL